MQKTQIRKPLATLIAISFLGAITISLAIHPAAFADQEKQTSGHHTVEDNDLPASKDIDFIKVTQSEAKDGSLILIVSNEGKYDVSNWSVAFNADFTVKGIKGARLVASNEVVQFKNLKKDATLEPGQNIKITLRTDGGNRDIEFFRVYGDCDELPVDYTSNDTIAYDDDTGKTTLMLDDGIPDIYPEMLENENGPIKETRNVMNLSLSSREPRRIISPDDRILVRNVETYPYSAIAYLQLFFPRTASNGTGFMIGQRHMLTCAHCIYLAQSKTKARNIYAYFYTNNGKQQTHRKVIKRRMSICYRSNPRPANDWACLFFGRDVNRGFFRLTAFPHPLGAANITLTGYTSVKRPLMYTASGIVRTIGPFSFTYKIDAASGQSGSPVYARWGNTAYGIHSSGSNGTGIYAYNTGCFLNRSRVEFFASKRWYGGRLYGR